MKKNRNEYPIVPKDFITAPIFASKPQTKSRQVTVGDKIYTIGGFKPISEDSPPCPALNIKHGKALFAILSFYDNEDETSVVRFSIREFCRRFAAMNWSGRYARDVRSILSDLERCWFKVTYKDGSSHSYRILKNIKVHQKVPRKKPKNESEQFEMWLEEVELHPEFLMVLKDIVNRAQIDLKTLTSISSSLAQAIYAYIPSRAVHCDKENPFEITLTNLLTQVGHTVPVEKSRRKKIFTQNRNSIMSQLDKLPLIKGLLRVNLLEAAGGSDYKIQFWAEEDSKKVTSNESDGVLKNLWIAAGGTVEEFLNRTKHPLPELSSYHINLLEKSQIVLRGNQIFLRMALGLLRESRFEVLLGEAKHVALSNTKSIKTPTHRFIHYIKEAVQEVAKSFSTSQMSAKNENVKRSITQYKRNVEKNLKHDCIGRNKEGEPKKIKENKETANEKNNDKHLQEINENQARAAAFFEFWPDEVKNLKERIEKRMIPVDVYKTWFKPLFDEEVPSIIYFSERWIIDNFFNASEERVKLYKDFKRRKNIDL